MTTNYLSSLSLIILKLTLLDCMALSPSSAISNACFGFDKTTGWTFFDLTAMHDSLNTSIGTVLEADFYHADQLLPQSDEALVAKVE